MTVTIRSGAMSLAEEVEIRLERDLAGCARERGVRPFDVLAVAYGSATLHWAGAGLGNADAERVSREVARAAEALVGVIGPPRLRAALARRRIEGWAARLVEQTRRTTPLRGTGSTLLQQLARQTEGRGSPRPTRAVAGDLVDLLVGTVALAWPATLALVTMAEHPRWRACLTSGDGARNRAGFIAELGRWFPAAVSAPSSAPLLDATLRVAVDFDICSGVAQGSGATGHSG